MRLTLVALPLLLLPLNGCVGALVVYGAQNVTKDELAKVMAEDHPKVDSVAAAACVQKAMKMGEVVGFGSADFRQGISPANRAKVEAYAARPEAAACIAALPEKPKG